MSPQPIGGIGGPGSGISRGGRVLSACAWSRESVIDGSWLAVRETRLPNALASGEH